MTGLFDSFTSSSALSTLNGLKQNTLALGNALSGSFTDRATLIAQQTRSRIFEDAFTNAQTELEAKKKKEEVAPPPPAFQKQIEKNNERMKSRYLNKIKKVQEQIKTIDQMAVSKYEKLEAKAKLNLEIAHLKMQSFRQTSTYDSPKVKARALQDISSSVSTAIKQFEESLKDPAANSVTEIPEGKEAVTLTPSRSFDESQFEAKADKMLRSLGRSVRQETISAARIDDDSRSNTILTLSKARSAITSAQGSLREMSDYLNTRSEIGFVDITV